VHQVGKKYYHYIRMHGQQNIRIYTVYFICKLLYMFRVVSPPIIGAQIIVSTASGISQL